MDGVAKVSAPDFSQLNGARIFLTGDTGFKGSWLAEWLLALGADIRGYALPPEGDDPLFDRLDLRNRIDHIDGDLRDLPALTTAIREFAPDGVMHLAAQSLVLRGYEAPKETFDVNIGGSVNLLEAVQATASVRGLVYVTSDKCYEDQPVEAGYTEEDRLGGDDPYSASKAAAEIVFAAYDRSFFANRPTLGAVSVRAGNVIGGGDWAENRIVPDCIRALRKGEAIQLRNPMAIRPWQHVLEPLGGYLMLLDRLLNDPASASGAWNFGPAAEAMRPVRDLANGVAEHWGGGSVEESPALSAPKEAAALYLDSAKAKEALGWAPQWDFDRTVRETVHWYRSVGEGEPAEIVTDRQIKSYMENGHD